MIEVQAAEMTAEEERRLAVIARQTMIVGAGEDENARLARIATRIGRKAAKEARTLRLSDDDVEYITQAVLAPVRIRLAELEMGTRDLARAIEALATERDHLRAERDSLRAQLAQPKETQ